MKDHPCNHWCDPCQCCADRMVLPSTNIVIELTELPDADPERRWSAGTVATESRFGSGGWYGPTPEAAVAGLFEAIAHAKKVGTAQ